MATIFNKLGPEETGLHEGEPTKIIRGIVAVTHVAISLRSYVPVMKNRMGLPFLVVYGGWVE